MAAVWHDALEFGQERAQEPVQSSEDEYDVDDELARDARTAAEQWLSEGLQQLSATPAATSKASSSVTTPSKIRLTPRAQVEGTTAGEAAGTGGRPAPAGNLPVSASSSSAGPVAPTREAASSSSAPSQPLAAAASSSTTTKKEESFADISLDLGGEVVHPSWNEASAGELYADGSQTYRRKHKGSTVNAIYSLEQIRRYVDTAYTETCPTTEDEIPYASASDYVETLRALSILDGAKFRWPTKSIEFARALSVAITHMPPGWMVAIQNGAEAPTGL